MTFFAADKEGFLRTETSLIQTVGRAARNVDGRVIMYADYVSPAMKAAIDETMRRRAIQQKYNEENGITPKSVEKSVRDIIEVTTEAEDEVAEAAGRGSGKRLKPEEMTQKERQKLVAKLEKEMKQCAKDLQFERAAELRDIIFEYRVKE